MRIPTSILDYFYKFLFKGVWISLYFLEITNLGEKPCFHLEFMISIEFNLDFILKSSRVYIRYKYWGVQQFHRVLQELD